MNDPWRVPSLCLSAALIVVTLVGLAPASHAADPVDPQVHTPPGSALAGRVDALLEHLTVLGFSGAIIVDEGGTVTLARGYGMADRERGIPFTPDTANSVGSITKQFTGAAILLLAERGELSVQDPITDYFEDVPADKRGITLHHLLTHTSGLPDVGRSDFDLITADDIVSLAMAAPLLAPVGEVQQYANVNYSLLGLVVERLSGQGYEAFLREQLFAPMDMDETGYRVDWPSDRIAVGYREGDRWGTVLDRPWLDDGPAWTLRANGGIHSTVYDMHRWLSVLRGEGVLSRESVAQWTAPHADEGGGDSFYGYGWVNWTTPIGPMIAHNGGNGIFSADFFYLPDEDIAFYLHGNTSLALAADQREAILEAAFDPEWSPPVPITMASDAPDGAALEGEYCSDTGGVLQVRADGPRLIVDASGQPALDALFGVDADLAATLEARNASTERFMRAVWVGEAPDLVDYPGDTDKLAASAGRLSTLLEDSAARFGAATGWRLLGSTPTRPVVVADYDGEVSSWVVIERGDRAASMYELLWRADGSYIGTAVGPARGDHPGATLIYAGDGAYRGLIRRFDRDSAPVQLDEGESPALVVGGTRFERAG